MAIENAGPSPEIEEDDLGELEEQLEEPELEPEPEPEPEPAPEDDPDDLDFEPYQETAEDEDPQVLVMEKALERLAKKLGAGPQPAANGTGPDPLAHMRAQVEALYAESERLEEEGASQTKVSRAIAKAQRAEAEFAEAERQYAAQHRQQQAREAKMQARAYADSMARATVQQIPDLAPLRSVIRFAALSGDEDLFAGLAADPAAFKRALVKYGKENGIIVGSKKKSPAPLTLGSPAGGASAPKPGGFRYTEKQKAYLISKRIATAAEIAEYEAQGINLLKD